VTLQLKLNGEQIFHELPGEDSSEVATVKGKKRARWVGCKHLPYSDDGLLFLQQMKHLFCISLICDK